MTHSILARGLGPCSACAWVIDEFRCAHPKANGPAVCNQAGCCFWTTERPHRPPVRIIVCGGRDYHRWDFVRDTLDRLVMKRDILQLIHGAAPGADTLADEWAAQRKVPALPCPADWAAHGRRAGPMRNAYMLSLQPGGVVAFPGGRGTADMVAQARAAGVPVWQPEG